MHTIAYPKKAEGPTFYIASSSTAGEMAKIYAHTHTDDSRNSKILTLTCLTHCSRSEREPQWGVREWTRGEIVVFNPAFGPLNCYSASGA